jgi:DNA modification methylase
MQYSSREGEHVLDLFGGSGSTLIAAEQTGRKALMMELDALYSDVIVALWPHRTRMPSQPSAKPVTIPRVWLCRHAEQQ